MKKKVLSILLCFAMVISMVPATTLAAGEANPADVAASAAADTDYVLNTDAKTLVINTEKGAAWWDVHSDDYLDYTITLANDIDVSAFYWIPVGSAKTPFSGTFDGQGHSITGLYVNSATYYSGVFSVLSGTCKNLAVSGSVSAKSNDVTYAGGIAGAINASGIIQNCFTNVAASATHTSNSSGAGAGGIVGNNYGTVENCYAFGTVAAASGYNKFTGGVAGFLFSGSVTNSYWLSSSAGNVYGGGSGTVTNCDSFANAAALVKYNGEAAASHTLLDALNAWVIAQNSSAYRTWKADSTTDPANGGYPVLSSPYVLTYSVSGTVSDFAGGSNTVSGLTVSLYASTDTEFKTALYSAVTNATGAYTMEGVSAGSYVARVAGSKGQYGSATANVTVSDGNLTDQNLTLAKLTVKSIAIKATGAPYKTAYTVGDSLDVTNLTLSVTMDDDSTSDVPVTSDMVSGFSTAAYAESQELTITYGGQTTTYDISVALKENAISQISDVGKTYDGTSVNTPTYIQTGDGTVTVEYKVKNADDSTYSTTAPKAAGDYTVRITAAKSAQYDGGSATKDFTISPKALTVTNIVVNNKYYDDTNTASLYGTPSLVGVVEGDEVILTNGVPTFASTAIADNIAVNFTTFSISGTDATNYSLTQPSGITADIREYLVQKTESYSVNSNDWQNTDFVVTAKSGYQVSKTNTAAGPWFDSLTATAETADGSLDFYVKRQADGAISTKATETYKIDTTAPSGTISIGTNNWKTFLNSITFGYFFNTTQTVSIAADADVSGIAKIEYAASSTGLTLSAVKQLSAWTQGSSVDVTLKDAKKFVYFARITDNAGNVTYLSTNGAEYDTSDPTISGVANSGTYYTTQKVLVSDTNLDQVTLNGTTVTPPVTLTGNTSATYVITATDQAGNKTTYTVTMRPIADLSLTIDAMTKDNVKSSDLAVINAVKIAVGKVDTDNATQAEKAALAAITDKCSDLADKINGTKSEVERIANAVGAYNLATVSTLDKSDIDALIAELDAIVAAGDLTEAEKAALATVKTTANGLLARISNAADAAAKQDIKDVESVSKENVKLGDKAALDKAKTALEQAIADYEGNYTEAELTALRSQLAICKDAFSAIESAEKVIASIKNLHDTAKINANDKDSIEAAKAMYDKLTENEKAMVGAEYAKKLNDSMEALSKLGKDDAPQTGDTRNMPLWIFLLVSGGALSTLGIAKKRKKANSK